MNSYEDVDHKDQNKPFVAVVVVVVVVVVVASAAVTVPTLIFSSFCFSPK